MTNLTPARRWLALLALALGGFGIGTTEFVAMGLLPDFARDLLPQVYASSPEDGLAQAGWLISAYALGVVVGAPTIAAAAAKFPRKKLLLTLLVVFTLATVASALLPTFEWVLAARFVAGLPHGAYFGIASLVAAQVMGPGNRGKGVALVLGGLTIANVIGVPTITWLGQVAGWRVAYLVVAAIFAVTFVAVLALVPLVAGDSDASFRRELRAFRQPQVWLTLAMGAIGFGGFFAVYSYISPMVTDGTGAALGLVPWVLVVVGVGMTIGNFAGGWLSDVNLRATLFVGFVALLVVFTAIAITPGSVVWLMIAVFLMGVVGSAISPAIQTRLMDVAGESQSIAAALNHSALNLGNSLGAFLGGIVIAAGFGFFAPGWVGLVLAASGLVLAAVSFGIEHARRVAAQADAASAPVATAEPERASALR